MRFPLTFARVRDDRGHGDATAWLEAVARAIAHPLPGNSLNIDRNYRNQFKLEGFGSAVRTIQ
jgi:hypothetical protein